MPRRHRKILLISLSILLLSILCSFVFRTPEPKFEGKTVTYWIRKSIPAMQAKKPTTQARVPGRFTVSVTNVVSLDYQVVAGTIRVAAPGSQMIVPRPWIQLGADVDQRRAFDHFGPALIPFLLRDLNGRATSTDKFLSYIRNVLPNSLVRFCPPPPSSGNATILLRERFRTLPSSAAPELVRGYFSRDPATARGAKSLLAITTLQPEVLIPLLERHRARADQVRLVEFVLEFGNGNPVFLPFLDEGLRKSPDLKRNRILVELETMGVSASPALPAVLPLASNKLTETRYLAIRVIEATEQRTPEIIALLERALKDEDIKIRTCAARMLKNEKR